MFFKTPLFSAALVLFSAASSTLTSAIKLDLNLEAEGSWYGLTGNGSGKKLAAISYKGDIFRSENGGKDWHQMTNFSENRPHDNSYGKNFIDITSNLEGDVLYSVELGGLIWKSMNGGLDWAPVSEMDNQNWATIASNDKGDIVVAAVDKGNLWISTDFGVTWSEKTNFPSDEVHPWVKVASNTAGNRMVAVADGGGVYISSNTGESWKEVTSLEKNKRWSSVTMNDEGNQIYIVNDKQLWISKDFGKSWEQSRVGVNQMTWDEELAEDETNDFSFMYVTCNGKGNVVVVANEYDNIYVSNDYGKSIGPILDPEMAEDFAWANPILNRNGNGLTVLQAPGVILVTQEESEERLEKQKDFLMIENAGEVEDVLHTIILKEIEEAQSQMDTAQQEALKETIDESDREIYGTENVYFEKVGTEERSIDEIMEEVLATTKN
jgi:photosystem II stability/assembly factor-like uncharacterized protein